MKMNEQGMTLVEMLVAAVMAAGLGAVAFNLSEFTNRETKTVTEDIQSTIEKFGASRIITRDLSAAEPSFNYVHFPDDKGYSFFTLLRNKLCMDGCERTFKLEIPPGARKSRSMYLVVRKSNGFENQKFTIDPNSVFVNKAYSAINWNLNPDYNISKIHRKDSPWEAKRLLLVTSEIDFLDCYNTYTKSPEDCAHAAPRPFKFLGSVAKTAVAGNEKELVPVTIPDVPGLLKTDYKICRSNPETNCEKTIEPPNGIRSAKDFFEWLPFIPGLDNRAFLSPVEVVEYFLERPKPNSPDHDIRLKRGTARLVGSELRFDNHIILMTGIQAMRFTRKNVSSPLIEYKMRKVQMRKSIK